MTRKQNPEVRAQWQRLASARAQANKAARALHKNKVSKASKVTAPAKPLGQTIVNLHFSYMGFPLTLVKTLGQGTYGYVLEVETVDGLRCAAKVLKKLDPAQQEADEDVHALKSLVREAALHLRFSSSPYIARALGLASVHDADALSFQSVTLLMELCDSSLFSVLQAASTGEPISERQKILWCLQIISGLCHLHSQKVIHLDVKLDNVLLTRGRAVISDFGLARATNSDGRTTVRMNEAYGAPYRPPEVTAAPATVSCPCALVMFDCSVSVCFLSEQMSSFLVFKVQPHDGR